MERDDRVLFSISKNEDNTSVYVRMEDLNDIQNAAACIALTAEENKLFGLYLLTAMQTLAEHPETIETLTKHRVDIPDFNELLRDGDNK